MLEMDEAQGAGGTEAIIRILKVATGIIAQSAELKTASPLWVSHHFFQYLLDMIQYTGIIKFPSYVKTGKVKS